MQYLVKTSISDLNSALESLKDKAIKLDEQLTKDLRAYVDSNEHTGHEDLDEQEITSQSLVLREMRADISGLENFADSYLIGDLDNANIIASNFDTYRRELLPKTVWELLGNQLVHDKDKQLKQELLKSVPDEVSKIIIAYKHEQDEYAENLEVKFFNKFSKHGSGIKDQLLLDCLNRLIEQDDEVSQQLVKRIKHTLK